MIEAVSDSIPEPTPVVKQFIDPVERSLAEKRSAEYEKFFDSSKKRKIGSKEFVDKRNNKYQKYINYCAEIKSALDRIECAIADIQDIVSEDEFEKFKDEVLVHLYEESLLGGILDEKQCNYVM